MVGSPNASPTRAGRPPIRPGLSREAIDSLVYESILARSPLVFKSNSSFRSREHLSPEASPEARKWQRAQPFAIFAPEARWCRDHEPGTLSYEWARSDSNDRAIIVVERYADKETAYAAVHKSSDAFKTFRPQLAALEPVITGHSYVASDIGYTSRLE